MIMDSSIRVSDNEGSKCYFSNSYSLELAFQESIRKSEVVINDESARRLRLRIILLQEENDQLHDQLAHGDDRIDELEEDCAELRGHLESYETESHRQETESRAKSRELYTIKAELSSMNGLSVNSTKLLTEKLSLTRELANMRPEMEHLRSQVTYLQTVLAEKLALQRQVSTLEIELETEKCAVKRVAHKDDGSETEEALQKQLDELRRELSKEKREKDKAHEASENDSNGWEARRAVLEGKIEKLRAKLRETRNQVRSLQSDLTKAQVAGEDQSTQSTRDELPNKNIRKRTAIHMSTNNGIGTPDGSAVRGKRPAGKRSKQDQTLLGEKSTFSITPFLNRTFSVAPETPQPGFESGTDDKKMTDVVSQTSSMSQLLPTPVESVLAGKSVVSKLSKPQLKQDKKANEESLKESRNATTIKKARPKLGRMNGFLDRVTEEVDENIEPAPVAQATRSIKSSVLNVALIGSTEPKKKKRKVLGAVKTLFDDDDGDLAKRPLKVMLGSGRSLARGGVVGSKPGPASESVGCSSAFGVFSPLKKDRRSVQASFLV